jgi:hypothetical protein
MQIKYFEHYAINVSDHYYRRIFGLILELTLDGK